MLVSQQTNYVAGLMFNLEMSRVALIRKVKPTWQQGLLNGIGGKIENGETAAGAMVREFEEETGMVTDISDWTNFLRLDGTDFCVWFYACKEFDSTLKELQSPTEEKVVIIEVDSVRPKPFKMVENMSWIISLAIDSLMDKRPCFTVATYSDVKIF